METSRGPRGSGLPGEKSRAAIRALFIVGFMGSGKSSVGMALSRRLGWRFEDLDARVELRTGRGIARIFQESGEAEFRRAEREEMTRLLRELDAHPEVIVALGGGAWVQPENLGLLTSSGVPAVFLDAPVAELWQRCKAHSVQRPLAMNESEFRQLYESRRVRYLEADLTVETAGKDVETVAAEVISRLRLDRFVAEGEVK
jgi:shikimate kinase